MPRPGARGDGRTRAPGADTSMRVQHGRGDEYIDGDPVASPLVVIHRDLRAPRVRSSSKLRTISRPWRCQSAPNGTWRVGGPPGLLLSRSAEVSRVLCRATAAPRCWTRGRFVADRARRTTGFRGKTRGTTGQAIGFRSVAPVGHAERRQRASKAPDRRRCSPLAGAGVSGVVASTRSRRRIGGKERFGPGSDAVSDR